jgi:hypothetical protein
VEVTNGSINVELPESLGKLLIAAGGDWHEGTSDDGEVGDSELPVRRSAGGELGKPIPMTHIPGVVSVSMEKVRKLVASGKVPVTVEGRTKLVRPSDVRAALGL